MKKETYKKDKHADEDEAETYKKKEAEDGKNAVKSRIAPQDSVSAEEEYRQILVSMELLKMQSEHLTKNSEIIENALLENTRSLKTLKNLKKIKNGSEMLLPIGGGAYVYGCLKDGTRAVVPLGVNISVECSSDEAIEKYEKKINQLEEAGRKVENDIRNLEKQMLILSQKLHEIGGEEEQ